MDTERLHSDIKSHLQDDPTSADPQNTSTTSHSQIPSGPSIQMVYYDIPDAYMSQKPGIYNYVFFSTHTTIPLQDTLARRRPFTPYVCITTGQDFKPTSRITANHAPPVPVQSLCAIDLMDFFNSFWQWFPRSLGILSRWIS